MFDPGYIEQVRLLLQCMPAVAAQDCFAMKGGTAINLFMRNMPRVSVDIDLTYVPVGPRDASLAGIASALQRIKTLIERDLGGTVVNELRIQGHVAKLVVLSSSAQIKIEPNLILRGTLARPESRDLCEAAQEFFGVFCAVPVVSDGDLYGGKLCAALDRQHPRDLFDVRELLHNTGLTPEIRRGFVIALAGHNRPMHELLNPNVKDISGLYDSEFKGMVRVPPSLEELVDIQGSLASMILGELTSQERQFLLTMKSGDPDWEIPGIEGLERMPALKWKLMNIRNMDSRKRRAQLELLRELLEQ